MIEIIFIGNIVEKVNELVLEKVHCTRELECHVLGCIFYLCFVFFEVRLCNSFSNKYIYIMVEHS